MPLCLSPARIISEETAASRMPRMRLTTFIPVAPQRALDGSGDEEREDGEQHQRIANISTLRQRSPPSWLPSP
jgi:hypothetical protein